MCKIWFEKTFNRNENDLGVMHALIDKKKANTSFNPSLSIGYRQSINRRNWVRDKNKEIVQDINGTVVMGFYVKLTLGFGWWQRSNS